MSDGDQTAFGKANHAMETEEVCIILYFISLRIEYACFALEFTHQIRIVRHAIDKIIVAALTNTQIWTNVLVARFFSRCLLPKNVHSIRS